MGERTLDLETLRLRQGAHDANGDAMCVMEACAYIAGEPWSDHPQCVSPVIAAFARSWNDALPEPPRSQLLVPLIPLLIGTRTTAADEETRAWMATDWLARVQAPAWLRLAGLTAEAQALESCARIVDAVTARAAQPSLNAAESAARSAARSAAWSAAWSAVEAAARSAAWSAAEAAAWLAAEAAAGSAAGSAAESAARSAARLAARSAAEAAAGSAAEAAAGSAAEAALAPTVTALQTRAVELLRAMCAVGREVAP